MSLLDLDKTDLADNTESVSSAESVQSCDSHFESMASSFGFNEKTKKTDLTLIMQGQCVYVSRAVLELTSPVFQELLDANEEESHIELEGKNFDDFVQFLACFYPGKSHKVTEGNVFRILPLADEYGTRHVINQCEACLQTILDSEETPAELFFCCVELVYKHKLEDLKSKSLKAFEKRSLDDIQMSCDQIQMYSSAKADLYDSLIPKLINDVHKYRYLFACVSKKRASKLQEWEEVKYFTIDMSMKADVAGVQKSEPIEAWDMKWLINISRYPFEGVLGTFLASLHCCPNRNTELVSCEGAVTFTVKNNIPWNENVTKETEFTLTSSSLSSADVRLQEKALFDRNAGFLIDKKYHITAHVLLQRPTIRCGSDLKTPSRSISRPKSYHVEDKSNAQDSSTTRIPFWEISTELHDLIVVKRVDNKSVFDWIETNVDEPTTKTPSFIRILMTAVCKSAIKGERGKERVEQKEISFRHDLMNKYLNHQVELELQALYALQALVAKLSHPKGVLRTMFDTFYDEDIILEEAFFQWQKSDEEPEGKEVALKQVVQFFGWLREAEDES